MHTEMWEHPATVANVATLRDRGNVVIEPADGRLTGSDSGPGRMPEPQQIAEVVAALLARPEAVADLAGRLVVVTAGGTREPLDPVRYLGNRSSGRQGYALALTAAARGARVELIAANVDLPDPAGVHMHKVGTAEEMKQIVRSLATDADAVVMAAAVADFRPAKAADHKLKKDEGAPSIVLEPTDDILSALVAERPQGQVVVGFAAETGDDHGDWLWQGRTKLERKGCDLLVVNQVGDGLAFGTTNNAGVALGLDGSSREIPDGPKTALADVVWDLVIERLS
jgi:phosphopantothenoylcysteine decarboxylase/phosphopantothenate--cysteine ligase